MKKTLLYAAGALTIIWGTAHLFPTAGVVRGFGDISADNQLIITMEWIVEGLCLIFLGILTVVVTRVDSKSRLSRIVYQLIVSMLFAMTLVSLFTGYRVDYLPFKLCPLIFSASAILIILGIRLKPSIPPDTGIS